MIGYSCDVQLTMFSYTTVSRDVVLENEYNPSAFVRNAKTFPSPKRLRLEHKHIDLLEVYSTVVDPTTTLH